MSDVNSDFDENDVDASCEAAQAEQSVFEDMARTFGQSHSPFMDDED